MHKLKVDVAVIGTGAAGMTAALSAAEHGAATAMFEKRGVAGGFSNIPVGGILCVESKYQVEKKYPATKDQVFRTLSDFNHWRGNSRLLRTFVDKTASTVDWLEKQGVQFEELPDKLPQSVYSGGLSTQLHIKGHGFALMKALRAKAREKGIVTYLRTTVKNITLRDERVTGAFAQDQTGQGIEIESRTVVIATGGFSSNKEMVKKYTGFNLGKDIFPLVDIGHNGDGIRMAWEAGAASDGMGMHLYYGVPGLLIPKKKLHVIAMQPYLWLNQKGERFIDETLGNPVYIGNALARQPDRCAYLIFDGNTKKYMEERGVDSESPWLKVAKLEDIDEQIRVARDNGIKGLFISDSLDQLAEATDLNRDILKKNIEEYNEYCVTGYDGLFNKDPKFLHPVKTPRFYAFRIRVGCHGTFGGIKINERAEVLNRQDRAIPGLYAAGYDACSIYGEPADYNWLIPGGAYSFALNSGRIAGENASDYIHAL